MIQKQVEVLRKNYESTSGNLLELLEIAKANEGIFEKTKKLILDLIVCKNLTDVIATTENSFQKNFKQMPVKFYFLKKILTYLEVEFLMPNGHINKLEKI